MKIAFTAPMKPLDHPVPSGDRTMGRLIVKALELSGHEVRTVSKFRSWRREGGETHQRVVRDLAIQEVDSIASSWIREGYRPDVFLTYHLYHKAPDWIGPALSERFDLPYIIVEASRAPKRQRGDWAFGFAAADDALERADAIAALHRADAECLSAVLPADRLRVITPFLDAQPFQDKALGNRPEPELPLKLLTVGMMRDGDKTRSYQILAEALAKLVDFSWHLTIVGDGPNKDAVLEMFPRDRITWLGALPPDDLPKCYATHDLFVWPAIREAFGLVFLEAQAAGIGVVAGDTFGVPDIVRHGETGLLAPEGNVEQLVGYLRKFLETPPLCRQFGEAAKAHISAHHTLRAGASRLDALLASACDIHAKRAQP